MRRARDEGYVRMTGGTVVVSRTLESVAWPGATLVRDDAREVLPTLTTDVDLRTFGSMSLVRQLLDAGLVDRLRLVVFPLIIGTTGIEPVFAGVGAGDPPYAN